MDRITELSFPADPGIGPAAEGITVTPDGNVWFMVTGGAIGCVTSGGQITELPVPLASPNLAMSEDMIAQGGGGNLWFTESNNETGFLGRLTPEGTIAQFALPSGHYASGIAAGPDGNEWITESTGQIGTITPDGALTEISLPAGETGGGIVTGADGALWFTVYAAAESRVGRLDSAGGLTEFPLSAAIADYIAAAPDGDLWITERSSGGAPDGKIARMTSSGIATELTVPSGSDGPADLTVGADGSVWFTEWANDRIGRLAPDGTVSEFPLAPNSFPLWITTAPDGSIWFTESTHLGHLIPP